MDFIALFLPQVDLPFFRCDVLFDDAPKKVNVGEEDGREDLRMADVKKEPARVDKNEHQDLSCVAMK